VGLLVVPLDTSLEDREVDQWLLLPTPLPLSEVATGIWDRPVE
jgi:hypothetical protein